MQVQGAPLGLQERGQCAARVRSAALLSPIESFGTDSYCIVVRVLDPDGLEFAYNLRVHTLRINGFSFDFPGNLSSGASIGRLIIIGRLIGFGVRGHPSDG